MWGEGESLAPLFTHLELSCGILEHLSSPCVIFEAAILQMATGHCMTDSLGMNDKGNVFFFKFRVYVKTFVLFFMKRSFMVV